MVPAGHSVDPVRWHGELDALLGRVAAFPDTRPWFGNSSGQRTLGCLVRRQPDTRRAWCPQWSAAGRRTSRAGRSGRPSTVWVPAALRARWSALSTRTGGAAGGHHGPDRWTGGAAGGHRSSGPPGAVDSRRCGRWHGNTAAAARWTAGSGTSTSTAPMTMLAVVGPPNPGQPISSGRVAVCEEPDRQICSLVLRVDLVGSRRIWPAHVGCVVDPDGSRRVPSDRLNDQPPGSSTSQAGNEHQRG